MVRLRQSAGTALKIFQQIFQQTPKNGLKPDKTRRYEITEKYPDTPCNTRDVGVSGNMNEYSLKMRKAFW